MTENSWKPCIFSRSRTCAGVRCPRNTGTGIPFWKRFERLSKAGVFEAFFDALASMSPSAHLIQMFNSTIVRRNLSAAGAKGGKTARPSVSWRGGFTTKIHAKADCCGNLIGFDLTGGEASDGRHFETLMNIGPDIAPRAIVADKGYASKANRPPQERVALPRSSPTRPTKRTSPPSSPKPYTRDADASNSRHSDASSGSSASLCAAKKRHRTSRQL